VSYVCCLLLLCLQVHVDVDMVEIFVKNGHFVVLLNHFVACSSLVEFSDLCGLICSLDFLLHWDPYAVLRAAFHLYCNMVEWFWWDSSLMLTTSWLPSVGAFHCWLGNLAY